MDTTIRKYCKNGHRLTDKTIRWTTVKRWRYPKCRVCESEKFRLKYNTDLAFRAAKNAYNLNYYRTKVAPKHALENNT